MNYQAKMDPSNAPAPIRKLIEVAKEDLLDRMCLKQYLADIDESSSIKNKSDTMNTRYLLFLMNNYSNEQFCFEVFNSSCDPQYYVFQNFNDTIPPDFCYGTYSAALLHCSIPYSIEFKPCLLDTVITAGGSSFTLRDLRPDVFLFEFKPDGKGSDVWDEILGSGRLYIDM